MNWLDPFRDRKAVAGIAAGIGRLAERLERPVTFMEVCGTHTVAIFRAGIRALLPPPVRLVSGPGCPVCVAPVGFIDTAVAYCRAPGTIVASFGDLLRVPGSTSSLQEERARGGDVRIVSSSFDALALAERNPGRTVIFLGIGFETTAPTVAASILAARARRIRNYLVLPAARTMPGALAALAADPQTAPGGLLCPAHVSAVIGTGPYQPLAERGIPCVVTGFEPVDLVMGVAMLLRQVTEGRSEVENQYRRVVRREGNVPAQELLRRVFVPCDAEWRGLGVIPGSGLKIAPGFASFDAARALPVTPEEPREHPGCRCGEVLRGVLPPEDCPLFGTLCTPETPVGACMVSSEGSCGASFTYGR